MNVSWLDRLRARDDEIIDLMESLPGEVVVEAFDKSADMWEFRDALRRAHEDKNRRKYR